MTTTIPEAAVQAMPERIFLGCADTDNEHQVWTDEGEGGTEYVRADLALHFLTGVKEDKEALFDEMTRRFGSQKYVWETSEDFFPNPEYLPPDDTQIGVEFAYEFLKPYLYAQTPSPRAQALEEAAQVAEDYVQYDVADAIRLLSSQPVTDHVADAGKMVADGWFPIETAPKDGTQFLAYNIANGYYNCWWHKNHHGEEYWMDEADTEPNPTHWRPLPASPGVAV
ncbi:hypothetical protein ABE527_04985 [Brucella sp. TWI432]